MEIRNARIRVKQGYSSAHFDAQIDGQWVNCSIGPEFKPTLIAYGHVHVSALKELLPPTEIRNAGELRGLTSEPKILALCGVLKLRGGQPGPISPSDMTDGLAEFRRMQVAGRWLKHGT